MRFVDGDLNEKNSPELFVKTQIEKQDGSLQDVKFRIRRDNGEFEGYRVELVKDSVFVNRQGIDEIRVVPYFKNDDLNTFLYIEDKQVLQSDLSSSLLKLFKDYDYSKVNGVEDKNNQVFLKEFGEEFWSFSVINNLEIRAKDVDRTFLNAKKDEKLEDAFDRKSEDLVEISEFNYVNQFLNRKEVSKLAHEILGDPRVAAVDINEIEFFKDDKLIAKTYRADAEFDRDE